MLRRHDATANTYQRWKSKYSGVEASELKRLKHVENENRRLRSPAADQQRARWGDGRIQMMLVRECWHVNLTRTWRHYGDAGLSVRRRRREQDSVARQPMYARLAQTVRQSGN